MDKPRWPAAIARRVADELMEHLEPWCEHICVAGSLRRGKVEVGDIEILYVPRMGQIRRGDSLFPELASLVDDCLSTG